MPHEEHPARNAALVCGRGSPQCHTLTYGLPHEVSSFFGRNVEIADVATTLRTARLVTLTGVGGVGKSRLALRTAAAVTSEYGHVAWVQLDALVDAREVTAAVLQATASRATIDKETADSVESGFGLLLVL